MTTLVSQTVEQALIVIDPAGPPRISQSAQIGLIQVEAANKAPPASISQSAETALIIQQSKSTEPALVLQSAHTTLIFERIPACVSGTYNTILVTDTTRPHVGSVSETALVLTEAATSNGLFSTQTINTALVQVQIPDLSATSQVINTVLVQVAPPINGSTVEQVTNFSLVQVEAPNRAAQLVQTSHLALCIDSPESNARLVNAIQQTLVEIEHPSIDPHMVRTAAMPIAVSKLSVDPRTVASTRTGIQTYTQIAKPIIRPLLVQSMAQSTNVASVIARTATNYVTPVGLMSASQIKGIVNAIATKSSKINPSSIQSDAEISDMVQLAGIKKVNVDPATIFSNELISAAVLETSRTVNYGSAIRQSMSDVAHMISTVSLVKQYDQHVQSMSNVKKTAQQLALAKQYQTNESIRSTSYVPLVATSHSIKSEYKDPTTIVPVLTFMGVHSVTALGKSFTDPNINRADTHIAEICLQHVHPASYVDGALIDGSVVLVPSTQLMVMKRASYLDPMAASDARRESYATYYSTLTA